jgi:acetyl esterase/lipase
MSQPTIRLWNNQIPLSHGSAPEDIPTLTEYLPKVKAKKAIVVCPGGAYTVLAEHEGNDYAEYLNQNEIAAYVLKYRLGKNDYRHPAMLMDAMRAIRIVKSKGYASVGIMGSSAGGHLAATASVQYSFVSGFEADSTDKLNARPDFSVLCYPVIKTTGQFGHDWSMKMLLGDNPTPQQLKDLDPTTHVTKQTPPAFLWHTLEDTGVPPQNSELYAEELRKNGVPYELHIFEKGAHGIGLGDHGPYQHAHPWASNLIHWLASRN